MERQGTPLQPDIGSSAGRQDPFIRRGNKADQTAKVVGEKLESAAESLRGRLPREGRVGVAAKAVTDGLESSGSYLQEQGVTGMVDEVESLIRRYPVQALLLGAGLGYVLSRLRAR